MLLESLDLGLVGCAPRPRVLLVVAARVLGFWKRLKKKTVHLLSYLLWLFSSFFMFFEHFCMLLYHNRTLPRDF